MNLSHHKNENDQRDCEAKSSNDNKVNYNITHVLQHLQILKIGFDQLSSRLIPESRRVWVWYKETELYKQS